MNNTKYLIWGVLILILLFILQKNCSPLYDYKEEKTIDTISIKRDTIYIKDTILINKVQRLVEPKIVYINNKNEIKNFDTLKNVDTSMYRDFDKAFLHENFLNDTLYFAKISTLISPKNCKILSQNLELKLKNRTSVKETIIVKEKETIIQTNKGKIGAGLNINTFNMLELKAGYNITNKTIITGGYIKELNTNTTGYSLGVYIQL